VSIYREDLAYIHDAGFSDFALNAAPGLLRILRRNGVAGGLVVDLGCGSGRWARELNRAGYQVLGIDRSAALLKLARRTAPQSRFVAASLWEAKLPRCDAVTAIGECFNYAGGGRQSLARLFARVRAALRPGGVFIFDVATPERIPADGPKRHWTEGRDWAVLVEVYGKASALRRRVVSYRKIGGAYRRTEESHRLRLYGPDEVMRALERSGFRAEQLAAYGRFRLPHGIGGFVGT
jgi:SAM-dependent methyltransferase